MIVTLFSTSHSRSLSNGPRWIRPLGEIRATATLQTALATLRRSGSHLARLIDDNGQTQAVIALEDILEQLVGEVMDATRRPDATPRPDQPFSGQTYQDQVRLKGLVRKSG